MTTPYSDPRTGTLDWMPGTASIRWIMFVGLLLVAAIAASVHWAVDDFRERALRNGERELRNTAQLLARHFDREFEDFIAGEKEILSLIDVVESDSLASSEIHRLLRSKAGGIGDIDLFDPTGVLIASSRSWPAPSHRLDEAEIKRLQARAIGDDREIHLAREAFYGDGALLFVQNRYGRDGAFAGVIARAVSLAWYERFFASVALGEKSAVTMFRSDGVFMARHPAAPSALGLNFKAGLLEPQFTAAEVTLRVPSPFDGEERLASAHSLVHAPITLVASRSVDSILADWREQTFMLVAAATAAVVVIAGMLFLFGRHLRTQQEATRRQLKIDKQRLDLAINNMTQGLSLFDAAGRLVICNRRYLEIYKLPADIVRPGIGAQELGPHLRQAGVSEQELEKYRRFVDKNRFVRSSLEVDLGDAAVRITREPLQGGGWLTTHEDITERKRAYARIAYLAHYDELTDLPNRSSFRDHLETALASNRDGGQVALLYIDIDEFKGVNDALGHVVGDRLLSTIARRLKDALGEAGFIARLGGDEFAVVMSGVKTLDEVTALAELIQFELRDFHDCGEHSISADASIGIAVAPQHGGDIDKLISNADLALYAAKAEGRRTYRFYKPEMDSKAKDRHVLGADLKRAVSERQFEVYYQPLVDLATDRMVGCEALLRWRHPTRGMVSPAEFIPVAEEIGLIDELGEWVLAEACREAATWPPYMTLAVNASPIQFKRQTFPLKVAAALGRSGLPAQRLELEITEAVLIRDDEATLAILNELRAMGVKIALDDFGTGYSSLSYLHRFPIDKIKIDRSFVSTLADEKGSSTIVQAIVNIAASGDKITLAEGVETVQQRDLLKQFGCHQMQGYLFSPAVPAAELRKLIDPAQAVLSDRQQA